MSRRKRRDEPLRVTEVLLIPYMLITVSLTGITAFFWWAGKTIPEGSFYLFRAVIALLYSIPFSVAFIGIGNFLSVIRAMRRHKGSALFKVVFCTWVAKMFFMGYSAANLMRDLWNSVPLG